jgi:exodeoxyribonuclease V alpha subunit
MSKLAEVCAIPIDEKFRRDSFCILSARQAPPVQDSVPTRFSLLGDADPGELTPQLPYRFWGVWDRANQYGESFRFNSFCALAPHNRTGVVKYLQQARNVGPATAETLWEAFLGDAVRVLRETPERAVEAVGPRFGIEKAREAAEDLQMMAAAENLTIRLYDLFDGRGFGKACVRQALKLWGARAVEILTRDPYRAMALRGVGFLKADRFYLDLGKDPARLKRQAYCLSYSVLKESDAQGHVWVPWEAGVEYLKAAVAGAPVSPEKALTLATRGKILRTRQDAAGTLWAADVRRAMAEEYVCRHVVNAMARETIEWPRLDRPEFSELTDHQRAELSKALSGPVAILGGRPGTGKSFSLVRLVRALLAMHGRTCVRIVAPTGKAAQRVKELMQEAHVSGVEPTTIHRGLGVQSCDEGGFTFAHNELNPLPCRFLIVEEASMLGTGLFRSLLAARSRGCGLLLVGDVNQLPPVEYGAPLRDMIDAGLPYGQIIQIHRNAGSIVRACSAICDGLPWQTDDKIDLQVEQPKNLVLIQSGKAYAPAKVLQLVQKLRDESPFDPVWDCQILVAVNRRSPLSRVALNKQLQDMLNPATGDSKSPFRVNDKTIMLRNCFLNEASEDDGRWTTSDDKHLICNGDIGRVLLAEERRTVVEFFNPQRIVMIPRGRKNTNGDADKEKEDENDKEPDKPDVKANGRQDAKKEEEKADTGCDLDLAYAVTCHKLQGSQAPVVIVCVDEYPGASGEYGVCDRAWLYTAISRAQKACFLIGMKHVADSMCRRQFIGRRKTFMAELIREMAAKEGVRLRIKESELW